MDIEKAAANGEKGKTDARRKREPAYQFRCDLLDEVNEPLECVALLKLLNDTIDNIWTLTDAGYYLDHIWNANADTSEKLKNAGFDDDYFINLAYRFENLREILIGGSIDYKQLFAEMYDDMLNCEAYYHRYYDELFDSVVRQRDKLQNEVYSLKKAVEQNKREGK